MHTTPFYAPPPGTGFAEVWHDDDECPVARHIAPADRRPGKLATAGRCPACARLAWAQALRRPMPARA